MLFLINHAEQDQTDKLANDVIDIHENSVKEDDHEKKIAHAGIFEEVNITPKRLD